MIYGNRWWDPEWKAPLCPRGCGSEVHWDRDGCRAETPAPAALEHKSGWHELKHSDCSAVANDPSSFRQSILDNLRPEIRDEVEYALDLASSSQSQMCADGTQKPILTDTALPSGGREP